MDNPYKIAENILSSQQMADARFKSVDLYGSSVQEKTAREKECSVFHLENQSGTGDIAIYKAFPGMELVYNDMHMEYCNREQQPRPNVMEINYCREGRVECIFGEQSYCYMSAGDLSFCSLQKRIHTSSFPTSHYHGITIVLDFEGITEELDRIFKLLSVDLARIRILAENQDFYIVRANDTVQHIFSELYTVQENVKESYIRIKLMELLLMLSELTPNADSEKYVYYSRSQRDCIHRIHDFMTAHLSEHYTIEELAQRFEISPTIMKSCFKGIYGDSLYSYFRTYRLQIAERLLREGELSVAEISSRVGYINPNKFSTAFRSEYGIPPSRYKKDRPNG